MPAQVETYTIDGMPTTPFRNSEKLEIEAIFGIENTASLTLENAVFVNSEEDNNSDTIRDKWSNKPLEGVGVAIQISDLLQSTSYKFQFHTDWNTITFNADNETSVSLIHENSIIAFEERAKAITFNLLESEGFMNANHYQNIPYIVENRKTIFEKLFLLSETGQTAYTAANEVFKLMNTASDIITLGILLAVATLLVSLIKLVATVVKLVKLFIEIKETFFPSPLYHSGVKPIVFIQRAISYLGYSGVDFGTMYPILLQEAWCPSKFDEKGKLNNSPQPVSGAMRSGDYGSNLYEAIEIVKMCYNARIAIVNNVVQIRPESDPYWKQSPSSYSPDSLVEQGFTNNGTIRPNYDEFYGSTIVRYETDDSDLWTLEDLADETNPATSQKIISGVTVVPGTSVIRKRIIPQQGKIVDIPFALCTRKNTFDDILDLFKGMIIGFNAFKDEVKKRHEMLIDILEEPFPKLAGFLETFGGRTGVMKVENHYFSTPKRVYLVDTITGSKVEPRIPKDYANYVGAKSILHRWYRYNSFVKGVRNPSNFQDTNAKYVYENVEIKLNLQQFNTILNNPYFSIPNGGIGKYLSIKWKIREDTAIVSYWKQVAWLNNATEKYI